MNVGNDYVYYQSQNQPPEPPRRRRWPAFTLIGIGLFLLGIGGGYFAYANLASQGLEDRVETSDLEPLDQPVAASDIEGGSGDGSEDGTGPGDGTDEPAGNEGTESTSVPGTSEAGPEDTPQPTPAAETLLPRPQGGQQPYPAFVMRPQDWSNPLQGEAPSPFPGANLASTFLPVDWDDLAEPGTVPEAQRIRIPAIDVDASVKELAILDLGDSRAYETPKFTVGHIPATTNPGTRGNGWYFGHLESPIRGEGSVFRNLVKVEGLLRNGRKVYVILDNAEGSYLYQVTKTWFVPQENLRLAKSADPTITLVTCWPRLVYDQRFLVEAKLVGVQPAGEVTSAGT